jgi:hypothetical protein
MALWQKLWLLFSVIWVVVAALNIGTILALSEEPQKALLPAVAGVAVPALAYLLGWGWAKWRARK